MTAGRTVRRGVNGNGPATHQTGSWEDQGRAATVPPHDREQCPINNAPEHCPDGPGGFTTCPRRTAISGVGKTSFVGVTVDNDLTPSVSPEFGRTRKNTMHSSLSAYAAASGDEGHIRFKTRCGECGAGPTCTRNAVSAQSTRRTPPFPMSKPRTTTQTTRRRPAHKQQRIRAADLGLRLLRM